MWGILIALLSGALMSVQGVFNTELTKQSSLWVSTGWVQIFLLCWFVFCLVFYRRQSIGTLARVQHKYILLGGVMELFITIYRFRACLLLDLPKRLMFIVVAQLAVAYLIELMGLFGVEQGGISVEKANRYGNGYWRQLFIQMGKIDKNSREKAAVF